MRIYRAKSSKQSAGADSFPGDTAQRTRSTLPLLFDRKSEPFAPRTLLTGKRNCEIGNIL
jgi:hypothetical protein